MTEKIINLKDYFIHHYDDWGRLYCVEFKGNPLELENSIKCLEQENNSLQAQLNNITVQSNNAITALEQENKELLEARNHFMGVNLKYFNALGEINLILNELKQQYDYMTDYAEIKEIQDKINEVLS